MLTDSFNYTDKNVCFSFSDKAYLPTVYILIVNPLRYSTALPLGQVLKCQV